MRVPTALQPPFVLPPSARVSGISPRRAFPEFLAPLRALPGLPGFLAMAAVWVGLTTYTYNTWIHNFLGSGALGADLGTLVFLALVFVAGWPLAYALAVILAFMVLGGHPVFAVLELNLAPLQVFVLALWCAVFSGHLERVGRPYSSAVADE